MSSPTRSPTIGDKRKIGPTFLFVFLFASAPAFAQRHLHEEFRFFPRLGIPAEVEYVNGADTEVFAFPAIFHVYRGLMVLAGPGWETSPRGNERLGDHTSFLIRTGVQYSFHLGGRFAVIPAVDFDFVRKLVR